MAYPENKVSICIVALIHCTLNTNCFHFQAADEHFENLRMQYAESITRMRNLADEATDTANFVKATGHYFR